MSLNTHSQITMFDGSQKNVIGDEMHDIFQALVALEESSAMDDISIETMTDVTGAVIWTHPKSAADESRAA